MSITFETAALADVMGRAARVAPTKGNAFDRAGGIIFEYNPTHSPHEVVRIKATDIDVTFLEMMTPMAVTESAPVKWRLPAALIAGITAGFPLSTETRLEVKDGVLHVSCGKSKAKIRLYRDITMDFDPFDPSILVDVPGFAQRVQQVTWACDKDVIPFSGVHIDGERLIATDRYRLASVPLKVPVDEPITVPLEVLNLVARNVVDAQLAAIGKRLHVMPTSHTQITAIIYDTLYPDVGRAMFGDADYDQSFVVDAELLQNAIGRMLVLVKGERYPFMRLTIGGERVHIFIDVPDVGEMEDEIAVNGAKHSDFEMLFTPNNFVDGLSHAGKKEVTVSYNTTMATRNARFADGDGYECWIVPLHPRRLATGGS